jgi:hypothetical protein
MSQLTKNESIFLPFKLLLSSQRYGFGIRDLEKTYPGSGSWGQKSTKIPDTAA